MIDRTQRDAARRVLRSFIDGEITNDDFEAQFPRSAKDSAIPAIKANVWMLYSDLRQHKLTGKHAPNAENRAILERCVLFLETDLEFEWPVPKISLSNMFANLWMRAKTQFGGSPASQTPSEGDEDVWPFFRRQDYDKTAVPLSHQ